MRHFLQGLAVVGLALVSLACPLSASASYPEKPIQLIVGFPPGGGNDVSARIMVEYVNKLLGQPIIVTNITGGTGSVGAMQALRAKPDGYTLFWEQPTMSCQTATGIVKYSFRDFDMINVVLSSTAVCVVSKDLPIKTAPELGAYMQAHPNEVRWPMSFGALSHFYYLYFDNGFNAKPTQAKRVANAGDADRLVQIIGGHADATCSAISAAVPYLQDVTVLGVMNDTRLPILPNVPTLKEQGINAKYNHLYTLFAPKGTSAEIKKMLSDAFRKALDNPEAQEKLAKLYLYPNFLSPEEGTKKWAEQEDLNKQIVKKYDLLLQKK